MLWSIFSPLISIIKTKITPRQGGHQQPNRGFLEFLKPMLLLSSDFVFVITQPMICALFGEYLDKMSHVDSQGHDNIIRPFFM